MNRKAEVICEVVSEYIGPVYSVGSADTDEKRLENLKALIDLIDGQLDGVTEEYLATKRSFEGSRQKSNKVCKEYLSNLAIRIMETLNE